MSFTVNISQPSYYHVHLSVKSNTQYILNIMLRSHIALVRFMDETTQVTKSHCDQNLNYHINIYFLRLTIREAILQYTFNYVPGLLG